MAWILLFFAGLFEIAWVIGLKYTHGLARFWPSVATILLSFVSFGLLARAARDLPIGTSYAVWTGIGAFGATVLGIFLFQESSSPVRLLFIALIVAGVIGLKLTAP
ncbi:MAG: quaternary ammonium compound efflux SMR transporter SugE [Thermoguttaceae bacterium]